MNNPFTPEQNLRLQLVAILKDKTLDEIKEYEEWVLGPKQSIVQASTIVDFRKP